jgi:ubiquitin C-terminal hydrolase
MVVHEGSLTSGHYVSYVRARDARLEQLQFEADPDAPWEPKYSWFRQDDHTVTRVDDATVQEEQAYLLFYVRKDTFKAMDAIDRADLAAVRASLEQ